MARHAEGLMSAAGGGAQGGGAEVRVGRHDRMLYATDASIYQVEPLAVVIPRDLKAAAGVVRYCVENRLPILPRGGGTSLAGQCVNRAVVIDFSAHCNGVLGEPALGSGVPRVEVEPGISIDDLNDRLRPTGLFFAPDPATARHCNIGGAIGNNAAGTRSILYGRTAENLLGVEVLLATPECRAPVPLRRGSCATDPVARSLGEGVIDIVRRHERLIRERFPKTLRRNAGYALDMMLANLDEAAAAGVDPLETLNLAHLICGSEGTLGVTVGATLKLHPIPQAKGLAVIGFDTLEAAIDAVVPILPLGPSAVELLDDMVIGLARANTEYGEYVKLMPQPATGRELAAVLYVEFFSNTGAGEIAEKFERLRALTAREPAFAGVGFAAYTGASEMAQALKLRKAGEPLLHGIPGKRKPLGFVEDNAVPVERLSEFVRGFKRIVGEAGTRAAFWAHASVGVLHVRPLLDLRDAGDRERMEKIAVEVADLAKSLGGVMSGEHGDGRVRGPLLERFFGPELMGAFREVKTLFDPLNLLNPGNIVAPGDIHSIHERTRPRPMGHDLHAEHVETYFDYSREEGFDHAVELCNGSGVCRKKVGGTMCPSYMGTLDERHSTRGRGNALRLAITGQLASPPPHSPLQSHHSPPQWNDPDTLETLNLCLSCKACKTECPSNVDIAKYKAEYLAQSYKAAGRVPLKARVFGNVRALNRLGSALAPLSNWVANSAPARFVSDRVLGLSPKRTLPAFAPSLFRLARREFKDSRWLYSGPLRTLSIGSDQDADTVILYADCFTSYNEPRIGLDAIRVLRAFGYRVLVPRIECCGRAAVSVGLLDAADSMRQVASGQIDGLAQLHKPEAVIVCEPSCLSSIKDEWRSLKTLGLRPVGSRAPDDMTIPTKEFLDYLADHAFLPEDFLDKHWDSHPRRPEFAAPESTPAGSRGHQEGGHQDRVLLHAHCHQKALWGAETSARLLRRVLGDRLQVLDTGCCGMAGSFGYTADRYDLSMKIGELTLFPQLRERPGAAVVAPGTSCRHQIHDGVARRALHPIELVARMLKG